MPIKKVGTYHKHAGSCITLQHKTSTIQYTLYSTYPLLSEMSVETIIAGSTGYRARSPETVSVPGLNLISSNAPVGRGDSLSLSFFCTAVAAVGCEIDNDTLHWVCSGCL